MKRLPVSLREKGISLKAMGVKNIAWGKDDAITIVTFCSLSNICIIGGDVIAIHTNGNLEYTYDNWYFSISSNNLADQVHNSCRLALDKIAYYVEHYPNKKLLFSFSFAGMLAV